MCWRTSIILSVMILWPCARGRGDLAESICEIPCRNALRTECSKTCTYLVSEEFRLFPGGKVTTLVDFVEVNELGKSLLGPTPRRRVQLIRKHADSNRDRDVHWREEGEFVLPIKTGCGNSGIGQPEQRDVIEHVVSREALPLTVERTRDELQALRVVVDHQGGQEDRRVRQTHQRLGPRAHKERVVDVLIEERQFLVGDLFVG